MTLPGSLSPHAAHRSPHICPPCVRRPSWAPHRHWVLAVRRRSRSGGAEHASPPSPLTASRVCRSRPWVQAPKPAKPVPHPSQLCREGNSGVTWWTHKRNSKQKEESSRASVRAQLPPQRLPPSPSAPSAGKGIPDRGNSTCKACEVGQATAGGRSWQVPVWQACWNEERM